MQSIILIQYDQYVREPSKTLYVSISMVSPGFALPVLSFNTFLEQEVSVLNAATTE